MKQLLSIYKIIMLILIVVFLPLGLIFGIRWYIFGDTEKKLDLTPYEATLLKNQNEFSMIAKDLHANGIHELCMKGNDFKINGIVMNFVENYFYSPSTLGSLKLTKEQALSKISLTVDQIGDYKNFFNSYVFLKCIKEDLNLKIGKEYSLIFEVNNYKGFTYISDGSITQNFRQDIFDKKYNKLDRIDGTNWYEFTYKNKYGI
ncbi:MAG: hypothetical protein WC460_04345 [Patescibacteria group bacterium]